jgi:hypothetical protein
VLRPVGAAAALLVVISTTTAGCGVIPGTGEDRSPEAFCKTYWEQKKQFVDKYNDRAELSDQISEQDEFAGMLVALESGIESLGDAVIIFDHLADHAPDDIRPDVEAIRDALKKNNESAGDTLENPMSGLANGLMLGLTTMGSWDRVGKYVVEHCGEKG